MGSQLLPCCVAPLLFVVPGRDLWHVGDAPFLECSPRTWYALCGWGPCVSSWLYASARCLVHLGDQ